MTFRKLASYIIGLTLLSLAPALGAAQTAPPPASGAAENLRDGQHDFDFDFGTWQTHSSRLMHPLSGSTTWADMDGITVVSKVWDGRANLAEYKADGPAGHVELLSLRWYNAAAHQWNLDFATPTVGKLGVPCVGEFHNGRGDFYDQEDFNGKSILVRFSIWHIDQDTAQSEQAFSDDGGKTWEVNWINKYKRVSDQTGIDWPPFATTPAAAHDFDFGFGTWHTHIRRASDPFAKSPTFMEINGTVTERKVWGGRAHLEEIEADGPKGHWEALSLFLYDPKAQQWSQNFINRDIGTLSTPLIGSFKNGEGELFEQDTLNGRMIFVRGLWSHITPDSHRYEESYSDDGGKTWKLAFRAYKTK